MSLWFASCAADVEWFAHGEFEEDVFDVVFLVGEFVEDLGVDGL